MRTRYLGRSGLRISELGFGTMTFGGRHGFQHMGHLGVDEARQIVLRCLDAGINFFDTADMYSAGQSEEVLGCALGRRRDEAIVATKVRWRMPDGSGGPNDEGLSRHHIVRSAEASLRRLGSDHIDLYYVHGWDGRTPWEETLRALDDLVRSGKVRYLGASNLTAWQLTRALCVSERWLLERFVSHQIQYNLLSREVEWELIPMAQAEGIGVTCWSPLAGGLLSGHQNRGERPPAGTRRSVGYFEPTDPDRAFDVVDLLRKIAAERGVTPAQVALRWLLDRPGITSVILGARSVAQLDDNLEATTWSLSGEEHAALDAVSRPALPYPYWHQEMSNAARAEVEPAPS
ncbi:aldo/keto reductase [Gandjariella thermophila]|uniref:Aldo/keto reductase n=1 Tax=Gandjariella thermophila TaxID=1931992 RepID=A0A4D4JGW6_9PSEU|nr:aldo/keto reductase [Gandjariella thermophila]GDY33143.1 aldo/keto reductase [Gandjariella thermophila]